MSFQKVFTGMGIPAVAALLVQLRSRRKTGRCLGAWGGSVSPGECA